MVLNDWLPRGFKAAICLSIDDIHPAKSTNYYEAGGDLDEGVLGKLKWLMNRHPNLKITLFTTADWREIYSTPTRRILSKIPMLRDRFYLTKRLKEGTMALTNHPEFVNYINSEPRFEVAFHGLSHTHKGLKITVEFQNQTEEKMSFIIEEMMSIFTESKINHVVGICPPGWNAPGNLIKQLVNYNFLFIASARDIVTNITPSAKTNMSGMRNVSLIYPEKIMDGSLIHFTTNFQATSTADRAFEIIEHSGLLAIKAHAIKNAMGFYALDGIDQLYMNYLDQLFETINRKYGDSIWWTSFGEISSYILNKERNNGSDNI